MSECNFTFSHYEEILNGLVRKNYSFFTFDEWIACSNDKRIANQSVLLRHDLDKSVTKALEMARIEASFGIKASYFIRVHSNYYNPFGHLAYKQLREIQTLGHFLGLHSEFYDAAKIAQEDALVMYARELQVFQAVFEINTRVYSLHRTTGSSNIAELKQRCGQIRMQHDHYCTYDDEFMAGIQYLSDSSGSWREGCICKHIDQGCNFQVLIHPDWWFRNHIELEEPLV